LNIIKQPFATRTENVTPFVISFWQGTTELTPASDTWVDTVRLDAKTINVEGNYAQTMALAAEQFNVDPQTGYSLHCLERMGNNMDWKGSY